MTNITEHPQNWNSTTHYGSCGQDCPCCLTRDEESDSLGICTICVKHKTNYVDSLNQINIDLDSAPIDSERDMSLNQDGFHGDLTDLPDPITTTNMNAVESMPPMIGHGSNCIAVPVTTHVPTPEPAAVESSQPLFNDSKTCRVDGCRFNDTHVTVSHQCGTCGKMGHGQRECKNDSLIGKLAQFNKDCLPIEKWCQVLNCVEPKTHQTICHNCLKCGKRHSESDCGHLCQVDGCRYSNTHVTISHQCGTCGKTGHGQRECSYPNAINHLQRFYNDQVAPENYCKITNCKEPYSRRHTTAGHQCLHCQKLGTACQCDQLTNQSSLVSSAESTSTVPVLRKTGFNHDSSNVNTNDNMSQMFTHDTILYQDFLKFNTSNVTVKSDMSFMFYQPFSNFNTSFLLPPPPPNVTDMRYMFSSNPVFYQPFSNFNTSFPPPPPPPPPNVTDMSYMFSGNTVFYQPFSNFKTSFPPPPPNVTDMSYMFSGNTVFYQPFSNFNIPYGVPYTACDRYKFYVLW